MTFLSFDSRRMSMTAALAAVLGFAALAGQGGPTATPSGDVQAQAGDVNLTLAADNSRQHAEEKAISRSMPSRTLMQSLTAPEAAAAAAVPEAAPAAAPELPKAPAPVAGLDQTQMNNAKRIVDQAKAMGVGPRGQVIAIATAMQESQLRNLASTVYAESYEYTNEGEGSDHDSVGLFQQRPQSGWGTVPNLMKPEYATEQFLKALLQVPGWDNLPLTVAAQAVQVSAYPDHYAKHEGNATAVVNALQ
jgi:hypothetical protein